MSGRFIYRLLTAALLLLVLGVSCRKDDYRTGNMDDEHRSSTAGRLPDPIRRRVMILYSAGYNSLSNYLKEDIEDLSEGDFVPNEYGDNILLVFSRQPVSRGNYTTPTAPALFRIYRDKRGKIVRDTLNVPGLSTNTVASSAETVQSVLSFVKSTYPGSTYGMVFSSHGSGWLPEGYYSNPDNYDGGSGDDIWAAPGKRTISQDQVGNMSYEIAIRDFRDAIPMHLNYIIMDVCLMGGVEVAWELRNVVDTLAFSQTEILAEGFDYAKIARRLLVPGEGGVVAACHDYFKQYDAERPDPYATVSVVDLQQMEPLAEVCKRLFEKYRDVIATMNASPVQSYFRYNRHWFYDLEDILLHAGIDAQEQAELKAAMDQCVIYKAATPYFISFAINHYSGLSMFLPSNGSAFLKGWYKENVSWNDATALVK